MRSVFLHLFTHADIRPGQLAELKAAGDPGKDPVLISVPAIFQRKIRGDDHRLFAQQAFVDAGKKVGKRERRRDLGTEIIYDQTEKGRCKERTSLPGSGTGKRSGKAYQRGRPR